jgi:nitroimidazol reductase NimA-like FMN-containing flavoprotein (pyridoxamine 5'-phosphate oxidase superfamily)
MSQTHDHEVVSIYPFTDEEVDAMMNNAAEAVLMWSTKDGWPVGVTHAFVWRDGKIWLTFASHRHRTKAIQRDNRVSVAVSSVSYTDAAPEGLPEGGITFKGTGEFLDDAETKHWFYTALSTKVAQGKPEVQAQFYAFLDSPLRTILAVTPVKKIMYNGQMANRHITGQIEESELGERLSSDSQRMNTEREKRGLDPR